VPYKCVPQMRSSDSNIFEYLDCTCQYIVPIYQRKYSWKQEQCATLWNDIVALSKSGKQGHFVGSVVRVKQHASAGDYTCSYH
jgi:uncharacterized protein with ParB-like and HNH nuclease domain